MEWATQEQNWLTNKATIEREKTIEESPEKERERIKKTSPKGRYDRMRWERATLGDKSSGVGWRESGNRRE